MTLSLEGRDMVTVATWPFVRRLRFVRMVEMFLDAILVEGGGVNLEGKVGFPRLSRDSL